MIVGFALPLRAQEYQGDIVCGGKDRFTVPMACMNVCSRQKRTLGNFSAGLCFFSSQCPAYGKEAKSALPVLYNQALFGRGAVIGQAAKLALASHIINTYYQPHDVKQIAVKIGAAEGGDDFAHVERATQSGGKTALTIQDDLFLTSPGYLISTIGHEMIHVEQLERTYKTNLTAINRLVGAMRELEASSWEIDEDSFKRSFGRNRAGDCMQGQEKAAQQMAFACRKWQVKKAIEDIRTSPRRDIYLGSVGKWLSEDPWASQIWLPDNPQWETQPAGPMPDNCKNP